MKTVLAKKRNNNGIKFPAKIMIILFVVICIFTMNASATPYFVAIDGNNSNSGNYTDPWQTLSFALSNANAGDTIYLLGGIWYGESFEITKSGTLEEPIVITSFDEIAVLDGQNLKETPIKINSKKSEISDIVIENIEIKNYKYGLYILADSNNINNLTIRNLIISDCSSIGIWARGGVAGGIIENMNLVNNQIKDLYPQSSTSNDAGILIYNAKNSTIRENSLDNMAFKGIFAMGLDNCSITNNDIDKTVSHSIRIFDSPRTLINENHVSNSGARSIVVDGQKSIDVLIKDNFIVDGKEQAFSAYHNTSSKWISNTVVRTLPGWLCGTVDNIVENNTFADYSGQYGGLIFGEYYGNPTRNLTVTGNKFINFTSIAAINLYDSTNVTIEKNTFADMKLTGATIYLYYGKQGASDTSIRNNVFYNIHGIGGNAIGINQEIGDLTIKNNIYSKIEKRSVLNNVVSNQDHISVHHNNVWGSYSPAFSGVSDLNTTYLNPLFSNADSNDFHLKSMYGRWNGLEWVYDDVTSPLIDAGDSEDDFMYEIYPNGNQINLGVYGNTPEASKSETQNEGPIASSSGISFMPSSISFTTNVLDSTMFTVDSGQPFISSKWYYDGVQVGSGTVSYTQDWDTAGTHTVRFDGTAAAGTISKTWTTVVSEPVESVYSSISISPSASTVAPGESFSLDVYIDPAQSLTGSQFDLHYSQLASVSSVNEGGLFSPDIFATTFESGGIDNAFGILNQVYSAIVGSGTISQAGVMATVDMVAGSDSGILELELANVILSDASSNPAAYTVSSATVLVDTAPEFTSIAAKSVDEGQSLGFTVSATDADGDDLTYTATSLPSGASFDAGTATFSWTPSEGDAGSYEAVFEVTDGYLTDTVSVSITVTPLNHVPIISLFEPADNSVFEEGSTINVNVVASDEDGQSLSYVIKIDGSQVSTASSYAWETGYESAGTHTIEVIVSDGIDEVSSSSTVTITDLQPRWDVNEDGIVNVLDITLIGQNYGTTYTSDYPRWDVNQDATVNIQDLSIVAGHFGETV